MSKKVSTKAETTALNKGAVIISNFLPHYGDHFRIASGNSDANCHRIRYSYAKRLVRKNPSLCDDCVYANY